MVYTNGRSEYLELGLFWKLSVKKVLERECCSIRRDEL